MYQRILITGANGLLGQHLVEILSRQGEYDVLATGRDEQPKYRGGSCGYVSLDITSPEQIRQVFLDFAPGVVINCAAMTQVDLCETEREQCWKVNVGAVESLARACQQHGARLVQVSTDFIFNGEDGPYDEKARPDPVNFYGKSKLAAENAIMAANLKSWAIARTVLVYGTAHKLSRSNIALWVIEQLARGNEIRVVDDQFRTPTYVVDLAEGIERIVRFKKTGIYHLSGREYLSVFDFARNIAEVFDLDQSIIQPVDSATLGQTAARPPKTGFVVLKAETELGYKPRTVKNALHHMSVGFDLSLPELGIR